MMCWWKSGSFILEYFSPKPITLQLPRCVDGVAGVIYDESDQPSGDSPDDRSEQRT